MDWGKDKGLDDTELEKKVFKTGINKAKKVCYGKVLPDWAHIHEEMKKPHVTLQLLWQEYKEVHKDAGYEHSFFGELYRSWKKKLNVCMRQYHKAGEKLFVDYCDGDGIKLLDRDNKGTRAA